MTYELALISVVIGAGYWGVYFVRQQPHGTATFGIMQLIAAALAGLGLLGRYHDAAWLGAAGAIGVGAGVCLLVLAPLVRAAARRLVAAERIGVATRLLDIAELLAPGSGVAEEKALVRAMTEIRAGRIEPTVDALIAARQRAPADAQLAIDERIAMLYLAAYRWSDAIEYAETHRFGVFAHVDEVQGGDGAAGASRSNAGGFNDGDSLRRALGIAPPVWVELLGAYGRVGDLERSATMLARLEDVCAGRDDAALWIHRARVMFLALAGRIDAVRALVARRQARHMSRAARTYWLAVAHHHHGDAASAVQAYEKARARTRGRPRELIDQALATLAARAAEPGAPGAPRELAAVANAVVARVEAAPLPAPIRVDRGRGGRATWLLAATLLVVSGAVAVTVGEISDLGVMVRAGALVHAQVDAGQWWRLIACVFLHVGAVHLVLNVIGLVVLGRLAEDIFGGVRVIAIFAGAGVGGALASYLAAPVGVSAGASGAVFGLLGAVFVELTWHRQRHRAAWKRGMWGGLAVVTVAQLGYGFVYPVVDQWAHGIGLATGALLGFVLSPGARWSAIARHVARVIALGFAAAAAVAFALVVSTPLADSLAGSDGTRRQVIGATAITIPAGWSAAENAVYHPDGLVVVKLANQAQTDAAGQLAMWIVDEGRRSRDEFGELVPARAPMIALPAGWEGTELEAAPEDALGANQRLRVVICGRAFGGLVIVTAIQVPETIARAAPEFFAQLLASIGPA